jgi:RNA polymerase sigma factor (sigma-70 family)
VIPEDAVLLKRFVTADDRGAFELLVARHGPMVLGTARRLVGNSHDAEDVFQAVFLSLARGARSICRGRALPAWLHKTTCRVAARLRAGRRIVSVPVSPERTVECDPAAGLLWQEVCQALDEELERLPQRLRSPLLLCHLSGLTRDEAARQLGWSVSTLKRRLEEGRKLLRLRLERRGIAAVGLALAVLTPGTLQASVGKALLDSCLGLVFPKGAAVPATISALVLASGMKGLAMKSILASLAAIALGVGIYAAAGSADPVGQPVGPEVANGKAEELAGASANEQKPARVDLYGDPLPEGAIARLGTVRLRQSGGLRALVFSPDGKSIITGGRSSALHQWDLATGKELRRFTGPETGVAHVTFSPDERTLIAVNEEGSVWLWDTVTGKESRRIDGNLKRKYVIAVARQGELLAFHEQGTIRVCNPTTGQTIQSLKGHQRPIMALAFSEDSKKLWSASTDGTTRLWDLSTGNEIGQFVGKDLLGTRCIAVDEKRGKLVTGDGKTARIWDIGSGKQIGQLSGDDSYISAVAFVPDGLSVAAGTTGGRVRICEVASGKTLWQSHTHGGQVNSLVFSPDGKLLASGTAESAIQLLNVATGKPIHDFGGPQERVSSVVFSPDGQTVATAAWDGSIRLWDPITGSQKRRIELEIAASDRTILYSSNGKFLVSNNFGSTGNVVIWDIGSGQQIHRTDGFLPALSPDDKILACATWEKNNLAIKLIETSSWKTIRKITTPLDNISSTSRLIFLDAGKTLACYLSPGPRRMASANDRDGEGISYWDVATGRKIRHQGGVSMQVVSPDGKMIAGQPDEVLGVGLWETATGQERAWFGKTSKFSHIRAIAFGPDCKLLAIGDFEGTIHLFDLPYGKMVAELKGHRGWIQSLAFAPSGKTLASSSLDTTTLIWDLTACLGNKTIRRPVTLKTDAWEQLWKDLSGDAKRAFQSSATLNRSPKQAATLFEQHLHAAAPFDQKEFDRLIIDLDSNKFTEREKASLGLEQLGRPAEPAFRKALAGKPSLEARRRIEGLLQKLEQGIPSSKELRELRSIEVLEHIATPESCDLLKKLAAGAPEARLTQEAKGTLERLARRAEGNR